MVDPVVYARGADTLEARLADARKRHADGEYGTIPVLIVELGIRSQWATEHPSCPVSPRSVRNEGGVNDEVDGGARVSGNYGTNQRGVIKVGGGVDRSQAQVQQSTAAAGNSHTDIDGRRRSPLRSGGGLSTTTHVTAGGIAPTYGYFKFSSDRITVAPLQVRRDLITWRESIEPQLEVAGLKGFADGTVPIPPMDDVGLRGEFRAAHLLTFMVISRCCSPVVQLALRSCRERLDAGHQAWHFILSTYQVRDDLYIAQLEEKMTHIRMGEQEAATDYCNRARRILAEMRMAGAEFLTASYISHIVKGLPRGYNLMKRMMMVPGTRESLDEDSITSYILQDEAMQEAEQPTELLPQANYAAPTKLNQQPRQRRMHGGGGSGGGRSTRKGRRGARAVEVMVDGDSAGSAMIPTIFPTNVLTATTATRTTPREAMAGRPAVASVEMRCREERSRRRRKCRRRRTSTTPAARAEATGRRRARWSAWWSRQSRWRRRLARTSRRWRQLRVTEPSDGVKHERGFNGALQPVKGRGTVALQGEAGKRVLLPDVLYVPGIQANLLSAGQLEESGVQLKGDDDELFLVTAIGGVLGRARYTGRVLCTDLRPCSTRSQSTKVVALRMIVSVTKSTPDRLHARLAHVSIDMIKSLAKHDVATGLDITPSTGPDPPCISCVGEKLARHTFPATGSDAAEALAVVHIDLCRPFRVAAKDGSLYFLLLKDRHTRFVWVMPVAKKSDVLREFQKWLEFTDCVDGKGIVHDLTCPYTPQQNGMAEREMRTAVESVRTMLLHMGVQHHWWHLALRQAVWVRNCLERSTTPPGTTPYQLLTRKKPDLTLARVWGCMVQFMVPEQQRGGKLAPKARWGLHLGVSPESKGWEVLDLTDNKVVTSVEVIFYETLSLEVWKAKFGLASGRDAGTPTDGHLDGDDRPASTPVSATGDEGSLEVSPVAPACGNAGGRQGAKLVDQDGKPSTEGEQQTWEPVEQEAPAELQSTWGVIEVPISKPELQRTDRARRPPERLSFHTCLPPAAFTTMHNEVDDNLLYDDAEEDDELPELDPDMHADPEHRWDIATMTVKEAMASWKGEAVKAAMEEEIRSLIGMGNWELVERPRRVNIMKNRWVLMTKYRLDDTVEREKLDMKNAFLQSKLDRVLYMYQPDYFNDGTGRKSQVDEALYFKAGDNGVTCWVLVYVDDLLAASSGPAMLKELKELLEAAFELREISPVIKYLGLEIVRDRPAGKLWLHQQGYADKLRRRFIDKEQGGRVPKTSVSVDAYAGLTFDDEEAQEREEEEYRQKVGSLQFAATTTRLDIAFACSKLGSALMVRSDQHWREVDRCLAYLANTHNTALEFSGGPESLELIGYVDADDAGDKQNRTSTGGYVFYVAATNAGKEGRRLHFLLAEFKLLDAGKPTILRVDNKSAITVAEGLGMTGNLKHMERRYAWLQHMVRREKFVLRYIPTTEQPADFLTKALHFPAFNRCSIAIGQVRLTAVGDGDDDVQQ
ncbi:unnamed protein product [Closterium sp. NIES-53]